MQYSVVNGRTVILLYREWMARFRCLHYWAGWIYLGTYGKYTAWHRKFMDELPIGIKPAAGCKDIAWTCDIVELLEPATGSMEQWADIQHLGWREHWRWPEIVYGQWNRVWRRRRGRRHCHLWSIQLSRDEPQYLEPKQHQWVIRHVRLDIQFGWTQRWQLAATAQ